MAAPFARLLLATEHGDFDVGAEALAFALARRSGAVLAGVLPLVSNPEFEVQAPRLAERADADAAARADAVTAAAAAQGVVLALRVRHGAQPHAEIVAEARERDADLLILRRRGRRGFLAHLMLGEMVGQVVAHAPCSVLLCPRTATPWRRAVLVGVDPQAPDATLVEVAARVAAEAGIGLQVLCVVGHESARAAARPVLEELVTGAGRAGAAAAGELRVGRAPAALLDAAAAHGADLLVVGRQGPSGRSRIGETARKVVEHADGPVLIHVPRVA